MKMEPPDSTPHDNAMDQFFEELEVPVREVLLLGAIPHTLDPNNARLLFPEAPDASMAALRTFRFVSEVKSGEFEYHSLVRQFLLEIWRSQDPPRFRQISARLAAEYRRQLEASPADSSACAFEWVYHTLAANPEEGIHLVTNLFHELLESRELGSAELLIRLVQEQAGWIGGQVVWLDYYHAALDFAYFEEIDVKVLEQHAAQQPGLPLAACCLRLLGRNAVRQQQWASGRKLLLEALRVWNSLGDLYGQALLHMDLGDLFHHLVKSSGGILVETREFANFLHAFLYYLTRGPAWLYQRLAQRIDFLPNLYGMNYQNWVAIYLMRLGLRQYRAAEKCFALLQNGRGRVETDSRVARLLLELGHLASAERLCAVSMRESLVQSSPYYTARLQSILGQVYAHHKRFTAASQQLAASLATFESYGDWEAAPRAALELAEVYEKSNARGDAVDTYKRCLEDSRRGHDVLLQSEVAYRVGRIAEREAADSILRSTALELRQSVKQTEYIDRYPGPVQRAFRNLANYLAYPCVFLFIVTSLVGSGISMQIIEGELLLHLDPVSWTDALLLLGGVLFPLFMIWGYYLAYALIGQLVIRALPFSKVDEAQPDVFRIDSQGITHKGNQANPESTLDWDAIDIAVLDDRALYLKPLTFSSRLSVKGAGKSLVLQASVFRYPELEKEVEDGLRQNPHGSLTQSRLSILRTPWLAAALVLGLALAVLGTRIGHWHGCYGQVPNGAGFDCAYELQVQPVVQYTLLFASIIFGFVTFLRWKLADRIAKHPTARPGPAPSSA